MAQYEIQLPYYKLDVYPSTGSGLYAVYFSVEADPESGGISGYTKDDIADAIRDAIAGLTGVGITALVKHSETTSSL